MIGLNGGKKKKKAFDFSLPFPGQALSLWLMSSEQGLRVTAVVTDSYGLSSSSGRKTSRDGEVTISAGYFESCRTTEIKKTKQKQTLFSAGSAQSTPTATAFIELKTNLLLIALLFMYCRPILPYYTFQQTHKSCSRLITRVWNWRWRDFHRVQMPHVKGRQRSDRQEKDERDIRSLQTASVFCFTFAWECITTNKKQNKIK